MYEIAFSEGVEKDLKKIRVYDRNIILGAVEKQIAHTPNVETKKRKMLVSLIPPFEPAPPIWELRVGEYRVFYNVDEGERKVYGRAVRKNASPQNNGGYNMKTISVRDLQKKIRESVDEAQKDRVVVTRIGKPAALLIGVEGQDWEIVVLQTSAPFWKLIEKRRKEKTIPLREMRKRVKS